MKAQTNENLYRSFAPYLNFRPDDPEKKDPDILDLIFGEEKETIPQEQEINVEYQEHGALRVLRAEMISNDISQKDEALETIRDDGEILKQKVFRTLDHLSARRKEELRAFEEIDSEIEKLQSKVNELRIFAPGYKPSVDFMKMNLQKETLNLRRDKRQRRAQFLKDSREMTMSTLDLMGDLLPKIRLEKMIEFD
jgi:hypothetical protein